jgi:hypothetical protein
MLETEPWSGATTPTASLNYLAPYKGNGLRST